MYTHSLTQTPSSSLGWSEVAGFRLCVRVTPGGMNLMALGIYTKPFKGIEQFWVFQTLALEKETELFQWKEL